MHLVVMSLLIGAVPYSSFDFYELNPFEEYRLYMLSKFLEMCSCPKYPRRHLVHTKRFLKFDPIKFNTVRPLRKCFCVLIVYNFKYKV